MDLQKLEIARKYAVKCHSDTNHTYDRKPYEFHLQMVVDYAFKYIHLLSGDKEIVTDIICACWCHDVIEDTRQTYNDVKNVLGERAADLVYALTNEKGKNRKERANDKYYRGISDTQYATFVKLCDRLANIKHSKCSGSSMLEAYRKEHRDFVTRIFTPIYNDMFIEMNELLSITE